MTIGKQAGGSSPAVAAIVISYNTRGELSVCLRGLVAASSGLNMQITVVDNASRDGSAPMVRRDFPGVRLMALDENLGFGGGINAALQHLNSDYVLVLNPDVQLDQHAIRRLVEFLERTPGAAAVAPMLHGIDGRPQTHLYRRVPSRVQLALFWTVLAPLARSVAPMRRRWFEHDLRSNAPVAVDQIPGAAMMVRASAFDQVPMDAGYFIWFEDVDWCYRVRKTGQELYVMTQVGALHHGGASFRSWTTQTRVLQFYRAFFRFLCKHRLDGLRRFALPVLTADLLLKELLLTLARPFRSAGVDRGASLSSARRAMRHVVARCAAGELVRFGSPEVLLPEGQSHEPAGVCREPAAARAPAGERGLVDAVIVNWNGRRYLPGCLAALKRSTVPVRIVVVDNASSDDSVAYVSAQHPDVELLMLGTNVGYAAGANAGLRVTRGEYAMVMNPDVRLSPDHLETLRRNLDSDRAIGAAQGRLLQITPTDFVSENLTLGGCIDSAGHEIRRSRMVVDRGQGQPDGPAFSWRASVFSACGAALFLRRTMLHDIAVDGEYFAESFFAYKEDIDLCWRARLLGWDIQYIPEAVAHHVRAVPLTARSWRSMSAGARRHSWKNHYLLMIRNDRFADIVRALPFIAGWEIVRLGHALLRDPRMLKAYPDVIRAFRPAVRVRRVLMSRRRTSDAEVRHWFGARPVAVGDPQSCPAEEGALR